jgi:hydrogenase nickel incorporation protein HypA/HybF
MHEYSVVKNIVDTAAAEAVKQKAKKITRISLVIGELSGYAGESLEFYFDLLTKGTPAEGAKLSMKFVKPRLKCPKCGKLFPYRNRDFKCPKCHVDGVLSDVGREFYIKDITVKK